MANHTRNNRQATIATPAHASVAIGRNTAGGHASAVVVTIAAKVASERVPTGPRRALSSAAGVRHAGHHRAPDRKPQRELAEHRSVTRARNRAGCESKPGDLPGRKQWLGPALHGKPGHLYCAWQLRGRPADARTRTFPHDLVSLALKRWTFALRRTDRSAPGGGVRLMPGRDVTGSRCAYLLDGTQARADDWPHYSHNVERDQGCVSDPAKQRC
jgi:hypothetical protein